MADIKTNNNGIPFGLYLAHLSSEVDDLIYRKGVVDIFYKCEEYAKKGRFRLKVNLNMLTNGAPVRTNTPYDYLRHLCKANKLECVPVFDSSEEDDDDIKTISTVVKKVMIMW